MVAGCVQLGREKMLSCRDTRLMKWLRRPFLPLLLQKEEGLKGAALSEKVLIRRSGWCYNSESRCHVSVLHQCTYTTYIIFDPFNSTLFTKHLLRSRLCLTWQKHPLLRPKAQNYFKDFHKCVRVKGKSLGANLNMKTKCVYASNRRRQRQISLGILIHEKAGTISAQSSSVIQSQRLWCEKGELTWKGRQIAEGTIFFKAA